MTYFNINALSLPYNLLKRKLMYKNVIGTNAGIVWRAMASDRNWTYEELKENNLRIGFNLYQLEKNNEIKDINKIVDENTEYLKGVAESVRRE